MLLNLTDISSETLQQQIIRQIRAKILASELAPGENIPSIRTLSRENHISIITVKRAYEILEREGLIHSRRGKGFFVCELRDKKKRDLAEKRLVDNLRPPLAAALAEGLSKSDILAIVEKIIK